MSELIATQLTLDRVVTLGDIHGLHAELREAVAAGAVEINANMLEKCDFSLIQLLVSACRTAAVTGHGVQLRADPGGELATRWRQAGLPAETFLSLISTRQQEA